MPAATIKAEPSAALRLSSWLPYRLFIVAARIARPLEDFYTERFGLNQAAWRVLAVIAERAGASASEIARACALDAFATSRGIAQLTRLGFARRATSETDRRFASVAITEAGRAVFDEIAALGRTIENDLLASLTPDQRGVVDGLLRNLEAESMRIDAAGWRALRDRPTP